MRKLEFTTYLIIVLCLISCINRNKSHMNGWQDPSNIIVDTGKTENPNRVIRKDTTINSDKEFSKFYFIPFGKDSMMAIPGFAIENRYYSTSETYYDEYPTFSSFKKDFLYSKKLFKARKYWSYHFKISDDVKEYYNKHSFASFLKKYTYIYQGDTFIIKPDTTIYYYLDKHGYDGLDFYYKIHKRADE